MKFVKQTLGRFPFSPCQLPSAAFPFSCGPALTTSGDISFHSRPLFISTAFQPSPVAVASDFGMWTRALWARGHQKQICAGKVRSLLKIIFIIAWGIGFYQALGVILLKIS